MPRLTKVPRIQLAKIAKRLKRDADAHRLITHTLMDYSMPKTRVACESAGRCAVGSLMFYEPSIDVTKIVGGYPERPEVAKLTKAYGLLSLHLDAICATNDATSDPDNNGTRYEEVMALVTFAEVMQRAGVRFKDGAELRLAYVCGEFQ